MPRAAESFESRSFMLGKDLEKNNVASGEVVIVSFVSISCEKQTEEDGGGGGR